MFVKGFEYSNEGPTVLHGHFHPVANVAQHLVVLGERHGGEDISVDYPDNKICCRPQTFVDAAPL